MMNQIMFRKTTVDDAKLVFEWMNDPETRKASLSQKPLVWKDHLEWFKRKLKEDDYEMTIAELDNEPIGYCRLEFRHESLEPYDEGFGIYIGDHGYASYVIAPAKRGLGLGKEVFHQYLNRFPEIPIEMDVKASNPASVHIIRNIPGVVFHGWRLLPDGDTLHTFVRPPIKAN